MNAPVRIPGEPAPAGHNEPPEATPFDLSREEIDGLYLEAKNWLDGTGVQTEEDETAVNKLLKLIGGAINTADDRRKAENKPFDDGKAEVQARYATLISDTKAVTGKAVLARDVCRKALTPWRVRQDELRRQAAEAARAAAEAAEREAKLAFQSSDVDDLEARERAEALARDAKAAATVARKAEKPQATGLRTTYRAEVTDLKAFARWAWENRPDELRPLFAHLAQCLCDAKVREMPGVTIHTDRSAR